MSSVCLRMTTLTTRRTGKLLTTPGMNDRENASRFGFNPKNRVIRHDKLSVYNFWKYFHLKFKSNGYLRLAILARIVYFNKH